MEMKFVDEVQRIKKVYQRFDSENLGQTVWAPFAPAESAFRCRQAVVFSTLMHKEGYLDLHDQQILDYGCGLGRQLRSALSIWVPIQQIYSA